MYTVCSLLCLGRYEYYRFAQGHARESTEALPDRDAYACRHFYHRKRERTVDHPSASLTPVIDAAVREIAVCCALAVNPWPHSCHEQDSSPRPDLHLYWDQVTGAPPAVASLAWLSKPTDPVSFTMMSTRACTRQRMARSLQT